MLFYVNPEISRFAIVAINFVRARSYDAIPA